MSEREIKKVLKESLEREEELYEFCVECLKKIFGERSPRAIALFDEGISFHDYNGCIQTLCCIESNLLREEKNMQEYKLKQKEKPCDE